MRGEPGATALALAGGFVLILVFSVIALAVALSGTPEGGQGLRSYYFRATIEVEQRDAGLGDHVLDTLEGWYDGTGRWRWSFGDSERAEAGGVQDADGETFVYYDRETNVYYRQPLEAFNEGRSPELTEGPPLIAGSFLIGWIPYGDPERFFEGFQDAMREDSPGGEVAGRPSHVVTLTRQGATLTFWIDRHLPFVLKYEARDPDPSSPQSLVRVEIVELELNQDVPDEVFVFQPPDGALEVEPPGRSIAGSSSSGSAGGGVPASPEGFLTPRYVPAGYEMTTSGTSYAGIANRATRYDLRLEGGDAYLNITQQFRAGGMAASQKTGEPVSVSGAPAYLQSAAGELRLVWASGDIVLTLASNALDLDELLRVAESMR
jgi:outer membrane lipoprotein-sorting protein